MAVYRVIPWRVFGQGEKWSWSCDACALGGTRETEELAKFQAAHHDCNHEHDDEDADGIIDVVNDSMWTLTCNGCGQIAQTPVSPEGHDLLVFLWANHDRQIHGGTGLIGSGPNVLIIEDGNYCALPDPGKHTRWVTNESKEKYL
jgi:hypothetical protein